MILAVWECHAICSVPNTYSDFVFPSGGFPSDVAVSSMLKQLAISLSLKCLSYDFVGTSLDESSEEFGTVQVSVY